MKTYSKSVFLFTTISFLLNIFWFDAIAQMKNTPTVIEEENTPLLYPWAGGFNSMQFGEVDIDRDGLQDLIAFDRNGNRKLCFINNGIYNAIHYTYSPEYNDLFPDLYDWAVFTDYNGDGKTDIFTYSPGWAGMMVYKNVSQDILKFELVVYPYLKTFQENGYVNLLVTNVDYPGIADIDLDGDMDILSFWGLGSFVNYHRNMSMEKYGTADSLDYQLEEYCWGLFAESEESNQLYFDTCFIGQKTIFNSANDERHTGSTFLILDLNNDSVQDLLLGDVDYPSLFALHNGGSKFNAFITSADTNYPSKTAPVDLFSFPAAAYIDVNNDGLKDLIVSPFDPALDVARNKKSVWLYLNSGSNKKPFFTLKVKDFLQASMIDRGAGAYPGLFDWDGDGLLDIIAGNYGFYQTSYYEGSFLRSEYQSRIAYFKNTGTEQSPKFQLWDDDLAKLSELDKTGLMPALADLDMDNDFDVLAGYDEGKIILSMNQGENGFVVVTDNYSGIDVGDYSSPQLFDLDKDGLKDLVIGEKAGNLNYYKNIGSESNPVFEFVTDSLGKVNVTDYNLSYDGYSVPWFFRLEDGTTQLLVGSEQGKVFYFTDIDNNLNGKFSESDQLGDLIDTSGISFDRGARTGATIGEIRKDGKLEMIVGNYSGGLEYFNGNAEVLPGFAENNRQLQNYIRISPNPANTEIKLTLNRNIQKATVKILNSSGQLVYSTDLWSNANQQFELNVTSLKTGFYILKASSDQGVQIGRLVIQR